MVYPVVLIPGLAASRLKTKNKLPSLNEGVTGGKLWVGQDMNGSTSQKNEKADEQTEVEYPPSNIVGLNASVYAIKADLLTEDPVFINWKRNLKLKDGGITPEVEEDQNPPLPKDDESIQFNRQVDGINGVSNLFFDYGVALALLKHSNPDVSKINYFLELVYSLLTSDEYRGDLARLPKNLLAVPYDWRVSPQGLQERYQYFSNLKQKIEELFTSNENTPVVIIAHSMGNRVTQYFLEWLKEENSTTGQSWIDQHIERYIAVSPPWIGAPQAIRMLSTDGGFNLGGASLSGLKNVLQSFSSIPWILPVTEIQYKYFNTTDFSFIRNDNVGESQTIAPDDFRPVTTEDILELAGAKSTTLEYIKKYKEDPNFSDGEFGSKAVTSPPVRKIDVIYSTGFFSPVGAYYYKEGEEIKLASYLGTLQEPVKDGDFVVINGLRLEKRDTTKQLILDNKSTNSGDGLVAYGSLAYFKKWEPNPDVENQIVEEHVFAQKSEPPELVAQGIDLSHNTILRHPEVIERIFSLLDISKKC